MGKFSLSDTIYIFFQTVSYIYIILYIVDFDLKDNARVCVPIYNIYIFEFQLNIINYILKFKITKKNNIFISALYLVNFIYIYMSSKLLVNR